MAKPEPIALLRPDLPTAENLRSWFERIDESRQYTNFGPLCRQLEAELAEEIGDSPSTQVVTASSGTLALELALAALGLPPGSRVLVPSLTFPATATAVLRAGLQPVLTDVDPLRWCLTPEIAAGAERIDAVVPVSVFGCPHDPAPWDEFTAETGVPVVIDAAGAFGNQAIGYTTSAVFSMHATKALAAGEGGFLATPDVGLAGRFRLVSNFGFDHAAPEKLTVERAGTNAKLSEYHAAVGLAALARWTTACARRLRLAGAYATAIEGLGGRVDQQAGGDPWVRSVFVVRLPGGGVDRVSRALAERGIETRRWYFPPLHEHPAFGDCERLSDLTGTGLLAGQLLGLPFHLEMEEADVARVCEELGELLD